MEPRFNFHVEGGYTKESSFFIRVGSIFFSWPEEGGGGVRRLFEFAWKGGSEVYFW